MNKPMRVIVFFDLPVSTKTERHDATAFRNTLLKEGFYMIQFSVYGRVCNGTENSDKIENRIARIAPQGGSIRIMTVTEKQYSGIKILSGKKKEQEKPFTGYQLSFF